MDLYWHIFCKLLSYLPSRCVKLRRTLKFCSGRSIKYLNLPIWQWSLSLVTLKLGMYSLPEQDKAVDKISYKPFTLKLLRTIQIRAVVDKYYSPLRMRISSELLFVSSKTSTTHSPPSCVESECSPVTIWSLQFRKVCDFIPALTFIAWSMRISQRKLGGQHKNLYPRAMQFVNEFLCVFLHHFMRFPKWKFNAGSDSPRPLWAPTIDNDNFLSLIR